MCLLFQFNFVGDGQDGCYFGVNPSRVVRSPWPMNSNYIPGMYTLHMTLVVPIGLLLCLRDCAAGTDSCFAGSSPGKSIGYTSAASARARSTFRAIFRHFKRRVPFKEVDS